MNASEPATQDGMGPLVPSASESSMNSTTSSGTASSSTSSMSAGKKVRRKPAPRISQLPPTREASSIAMERADSQGSHTSSKTLEVKELPVQPPAAGPSRFPLHSNGSSGSVTRLTTLVSQPMHQVASTSSTSSSTSTTTTSRPTLGARSASGGARIAAFASKFGSSASNTVHRVAAATHNATQSAAAALSSNKAGGSSPNFSSTSTSGPVTPVETSSNRTLAEALKGRGTNLVAGAAAMLGRGKGKERSNALTITADSAAMAPSLSRGASSNSTTSNTDMDHTITEVDSRPRGASLARSTSGKSRCIYGVRVSVGRAGEVFGAPIRVAADRTKLEDEKLPDLAGSDMEEAERRREACKVLPAIAIRCLDYLNEYGRTEEGRYRIPGSTGQVANLRTIFDAGADIDLLATLSTRDVEPSAVASCFKLWLRELPEPLLHSLEREIDILLMEHTGNAASSKVTMAQAQSPTQPTMISPNPNAAEISPMVVSRIKELFARSLPVEHIVLLREICYHLAHLAHYASATKMTFANLRLILSPTLKLSPVMLSILVNERDHVFPKPGQLNLSERNYRGPSRQSLFNGLSEQTSDLSLSLPSEAPMLPMPVTVTERGLPALPIRLQTESTARTPFSSDDSAWSTISSSSKGSNGSYTNYRASWHVVDFPQRIGEGSDGSDEHASTPIAKKFLHSKNASLSNLLGESTSSTSSSAMSQKPSPPSRQNSVLSRTPTLSGGRNSPSPFFSAGAPPAGLGLMATQAKKRNSTSSIHSVNSITGGVTPTAESGGRPVVRGHRRYSSQSSYVAPPPITLQTDSGDAQAMPQADEEEELSSSDTNTSICSSVSSTATPKDSVDLDHSGDSFDMRRRTITAETYGLSTRSAEMKKKRGSVMLLNLSDRSGREKMTGY